MRGTRLVDGADVADKLSSHLHGHAAEVGHQVGTIVVARESALCARKKSAARPVSADLDIDPKLIQT